MSWMPNFSYVKSSYKDSDGEFRFMKKKKGVKGGLCKNLAEPIKALAKQIKSLT